MTKNNLIRFVNSLLFLPVMTLSFGNINGTDLAQNALAEQLNTASTVLAFNQDNTLDAKTLQARADAIDSYFALRNMPLEGKGMKMVEEAINNELDWRLIPAIAVRESTGGKFKCKKVSYNPFGWGSCKIGFKSYDQAIEVVAKNLGGNNPNTAKHYEDKDTKEILRAYNPPSIVPKYAEQAMDIMDTISPHDVQIAKA